MAVLQDEIDELVKQLAAGNLSADEFQRRADDIALRHAAEEKVNVAQSANIGADDYLAKSILRKLKAI